MGLHHEFRPASFEEFVGNKAGISVLKSQLAKEPGQRSQAYLFHGPAGTGKTSFARLYRDLLECSESAWYEYNSSNTRGIDTIRELDTQSRYMPIEGTVKCYLLDECFSPDTLVNTPDGRKRIDEVSPGDKVYNLNGVDEVVNVFKNMVTLDRVVRVNFTDGSHVVCSEDHEFYQAGKWIKAKDLTGEHLLSYVSERMSNTHSPKELKNEHDENVPVLQSRVHGVQVESEVLLQKPCREVQTGELAESRESMQVLRNSISGTPQRSDVLQPEMCSKVEEQRSGYTEEDVQSADSESNFRRSEEVCTNRSREGTCEEIIGEDEKEQSRKGSEDPRKDKRNEAYKRHSECVGWGTRGERETNAGIAENACGGIGMDSGTPNPNCQSCREREEEGVLCKACVTDMLQSGHCEPRIADSNRGGRELTQDSLADTTRQEEGLCSSVVGVESVTFFCRGSNDESFRGVIGDKECSQGYVILYDLEIKENHSYIAGGVMVHNCHSLTKAAQEALLKLLEDSPPNTYFFLATTDPQKLTKALKSRCTLVATESPSPREMTEHLNWILDELGISEEEEDKKDFQPVLKAIVESADGSVRDAVKILDSVWEMESFEDMLNAAHTGIPQDEDPNQIVKILIDNKTKGAAKWKALTPILKTVDNNMAEGIRLRILGYLSAVVLNSGSTTIGGIMECFTENYYDSGKAGLILSCLQAVHSA